MRFELSIARSVLFLCFFCSVLCTLSQFSSPVFSCSVLCTLKFTSEDDMIDRLFSCGGVPLNCVAEREKLHEAMQHEEHAGGERQLPRACDSSPERGHGVRECAQPGRLWSHHPLVRTFADLVSYFRIMFCRLGASLGIPIQKWYVRPSVKKLKRGSKRTVSGPYLPKKPLSICEGALNKKIVRPCCFLLLIGVQLSR